MLRYCVAFLCPLIAAALHCLRMRWRRNRDGVCTVAFLHPKCASGGGGERVLWSLIQSFLLHPPPTDATSRIRRIVVYSEERHDIQQLLALTSSQFGFKWEEAFAAAHWEKISKDVFTDGRTELRLVHVKTAPLLQPSKFGGLTLLRQGLGASILGLESLLRFTPDVFVDTTGCAGAYPWVSLFGCQLLVYLHYPMIHQAMTDTVRRRELGTNNSALVANWRSLSTAKEIYYVILGRLYRWCGLLARGDVIANSSWTQRQICEIWGEKPPVIFPPVSFESFIKEDGKGKYRENVVVSCAQFRPEKNQKLQIAIAEILMNRRIPGFKFLMCGGTRMEEDEALADALEEDARRRGLTPDILQVLRNLSIEELRDVYHQAKVGIHTMVDEHFGIAMVEFFAAGLVVVAHNSGGPAEDIIVPMGDGGSSPGLLAVTAEEFADAIGDVLLDFDSTLKMREEGRRALEMKFNDDQKFASKCRTFWRL